MHSDHSSWFLPTAAAEVPQNPSLWDLLLQLSEREREGGREGERGRERQGGREGKGAQVLERGREGGAGRMDRERCIIWSNRTSVYIEIERERSSVFREIVKKEQWFSGCTVHNERLSKVQFFLSLSHLASLNTLSRKDLSWLGSKVEGTTVGW